jgi:cellulose synthase/poly-beta-1,6-N-acetylglucosamine synthase-like glycosyltransferase
MCALLLLVTVCLVTGLVPGYALWLSRRRHASSPPTVRASAPLPHVDVIVAVHDEAELIEGKLENLLRLAYPPEALTFWIVDGASTDGTAERVRPWTRRDARFRLVRLGVADKTAQLNAALALARGPWILVTDADARLAPDTLTLMIATGENDPSLAALGTPVVPATAHPLEQLYWRMANRMRRAESGRGSASIVIATCYAFRCGLLECLPPDVLNDDVHVSFAAAASGGRVALVDRTVIELRAPTRLAELFCHKRRKAEGYLREVLRFLPRIGSMASPAREVFLWRAALLVAFPLLAAIGGLFLAAWMAGGTSGVSGIVAGVLALPPLLAAAACAGGWRPPGVVLYPALGLLLAAVQLTALVVHPFSRLTSCYPKVTTSADGARRAEDPAARQAVVGARGKP